jgi:hypothetical protein
MSQFPSYSVPMPLVEPKRMRAHTVKAQFVSSVVVARAAEVATLTRQPLNRCLPLADFVDDGAVVSWASLPSSESRSDGAQLARSLLVSLWSAIS